MKSTLSAAHASAIFFAMRQTNFSDSMTHGPRMNTGHLPPIETFPILRGLAFINHVQSRDAGDCGQSLLPSALSASGRGGSPEPPLGCLRLTKSATAKGA